MISPPISYKLLIFLDMFVVDMGKPQCSRKWPMCDKDFLTTENSRFNTKFSIIFPANGEKILFFIYITVIKNIKNRGFSFSFEHTGALLKRL